MLNVTLICVGKLKEQYLRDACAEYEKRLATLCRLQILQLAARPLPDNPSQSEIDAALDAEGKLIISRIPSGSRVFTLCIEGKERTSQQLASLLESTAVGGNSRLTFIIGGSYGLSDEVKRLSHERLSMSKMTFPHRLARVMLLEQLYRAMQINLGTKYHK